MAARHELMISGDNIDDLLVLGLNESEVASFLRDELLMASHQSTKNSCFSDLSRLLYAEVKVPLVNKHLAKLDKASMANGVEARVPFLDHRLVDLAFRMPDEVKRKKQVLRTSLRGRVPPEILRDRKRGFNVPMHRWLHEYIIRGDWRNLWTDRFEDLGFVSQASVRKLVQQHASQKKSNFFTLWSLHALRVWLDNNKFSS
jgi:asparagine synthase (glutamine-hydrolysing)